MDMYQKREMRKNKKMNEDTKSLPSTSINWFPGHMVKAQNEIKNNLKLIDVVVEILDARVPIASHNKLMDELAKDKKRIVVLNKSDLADKVELTKWEDYYKNRGDVCVLINANKSEKQTPESQAMPSWRSSHCIPFWKPFPTALREDLQAIPSFPARYRTAACQG